MSIVGTCCEHCLDYDNCIVARCADMLLEVELILYLHDIQCDLYDFSRFFWQFIVFASCIILEVSYKVGSIVCWAVIVCITQEGFQV